MEVEARIEGTAWVYLPELSPEINGTIRLQNLHIEELERKVDLIDAKMKDLYHELIGDKEYHGTHNTDTGSREND